MSELRKQRGFHAVELVVVLVVIGVIGATGYGVWKHAHKTPVVGTIPAAIKSTKDLDTVSKTVNQLDTSTNNLTDLNNIEQELNAL